MSAKIGNDIWRVIIMRQSHIVENQIGEMSNMIKSIRQRLFSIDNMYGRTCYFGCGGSPRESVKFFKDIFSSAIIFSFEPLPENFDELKKVSDFYNTTAINKALGRTTGKVKFYQQSISHLGGLLPINRTSVDSLGYAANAENLEITVDCATLDDVACGLGLKFIDILKIDVQGYEVGVLEGASSILDNVQIIMIEVSLFDFYSDAKGTWFGVNRILDEFNFELFDVAKVSKNPKNLRTDWVELIFAKSRIQE